MGLSNGERYGHIVHSIAHINDLRQPLTGKLAKLTDKLWYEFLKNESNGAFWFTGSDLGDNNIGECGLIPAAFKCHTYKNNKHNLPDNEAFDYLKYYEVAADFTAMPYLLNTNDGISGNILEIYLNTEKIAYALCRYNDEFMESYAGLNNVIRQIQGECFCEFKDNRAYSHAWMLAKLCDETLTLDEEDLVNSWWREHCLHHDIRIVNDEYEIIFNLFRKYQFKKLTLKDRVDTTLVMTGSRYFHEFRHKEFIQKVKDYNKDRKKDRLNLASIEKHFKNVSIKNKKEEKEACSDQSCNFTGNYVDFDGKLHNSRFKDENT